jgi:hypothetical protein
LPEVKIDIMKKKVVIVNKIALIVYAGTEGMESMGRLSNALMFASEAASNGDDLKLIFAGTGARWIGELEKPEHRFHELYSEVKPHITGVCAHCADVFQAREAIEAAGIALIDEYRQHPSLRKLTLAGYQVLTF